MASSSYRAKVYILNSDGNWDYFGTGNVDLVQDNYKEISVNCFRVISDGTWKGESNEATKEIKKKLKSDKDEESYILYRPILKEMEFQKQGACTKSCLPVHRPKSLPKRKSSERAAKKAQKTEAKISSGKNISKVASPDTRSSPKKVSQKIKKESLRTKEKKASPKAVAGTGNKARKG